MPRVLPAAFALIIAVAPGSEARAGMPGSIAFTAQLEENGAPMTGSHSFDFALYVASDPNPVWGESFGTVEVVDGFVDIELGTVSSLTGAVAQGELSLEVTVDGVILAPRVEILSVPFALRAADADSLAGFAVTAFFKLGSLLVCAGGEQVIGLDAATGNVICAPDSGGGTTYTAGAGLQLVGTQFSIAAGGVGAGHLAANSVFSAKIVNGSILGEDIATSQIGASHIVPDSIGQGQIATGGVGAAEIASDAVGSVEIASAAVGADEIATGAVGSNEILDGEIKGVDIAQSTIQAGNLAVGAVQTLAILNSTILGEDISAGAIDSVHLAPGAVGSGAIEDGSVGTVDLADGAATMAKVSLPMGQGVEEIDFPQGDTTFFMFPGVAGGMPVGGSCLVNATLMLTWAGGNFDTGGLFWVAVRENGTTTSHSTSSEAFVPAYNTNDSFSRSSAAATAVFPVTAGKSYEFGCRMRNFDPDSGGPGSNFVKCKVTWVCQ